MSHLTTVILLAAEAPDQNPGLLDIAFGSQSAPNTAVSVVLVLIGMLLITKGGDIFTDSAVAIARATRIPPVIIGATIVSIATTFPEFMVSFSSAVTGKPAFAVGNALGSCCCNIGLIVGTCALLKGILAKKRGEEPGIPASRVTLKGPGSFMIVAGSSVWIFGWFDAGEAGKHGIAAWQAVALVLILIVYLAYSLRSAMRARFEGQLDEEEAKQEEQLRAKLSKEALLFLLGALLVVLGARLMVVNAGAIARTMGVPELIVGLTVLAVGTSLPEYTISFLAVYKGHGSLGIGNIIGANVLNICWVVATCALVSPLEIEPQTLFLDGPVVLLLMGLLLGLGWKNEKISATTGAILFAVYCSYLVVMVLLFGFTN